MKKIRYLWLLAFLPCIATAQSPSSTMVTRAAKIYMQIFCPDMPSQTIGKVYKNAIQESTMTISNDAMMNLIEFKQGGWILMSNDINADPVLAYSESGAWESDTNFIPSALVELLCDYIEQINEIKASTKTKSVLPPEYQANQEKWQGLQSSTSSYVYSLTQSKTRNVPNLLVDNNGNEVMWGQAWNFNGGANPKYNKFTQNGCKISEDNNNTGHKYLGCAAVAMGQLMWYWKFPPQYDWNKMPYKLDYMSTIEEENNIAHFLKTCGDKASVNYGCSFSWTTTNNIESGMRDMHYPKSNKRRRGDIDTGEWWPNLIKRQLNNSWPVIYRGDKNDFSGQKHFWVISGYNQDDKFYCNWGWGYSNLKYNGYYALNSMKIDKDHDYRKNNMIVRNIYPDWSDTENWTGSNITKGNDEELRIFCTNARMKNITLKGNSQSKIAFTGELIIDGAFTVSDNATLTLACYDKELAAQQASTNALQMTTGNREENDDFRMNENLNHDFAFEEQQVDHNFILSPNPTQGEFSVSMNPYADEQSVKDIYVYNSHGKICFQSQFKGNFSTNNIPDLPKGVYIVRVTYNGISSTQKLLIQ